MKINKVLCLLLAFAMIFSLCACSSGNASSVSGTVTESGSETAEEPGKDADEDFSVGATVNNTYENAFFGIGIALDENWVFQTQEVINAANGFAQDVLDNDAYAKALEDGKVYTDMSAYADEGQMNMKATIEKLNAISTIAFDEEGYLDIAMENNDFKTIFEEMGFEVSVVEKGVVTIAGEEHPCVVIEGTTQGMGFYEKVAAIKKGNYVLAVTVATVMDNIVDDVFANFYAL